MQSAASQYTSGTGSFKILTKDVVGTAHPAAFRTTPKTDESQERSSTFAMETVHLLAQLEAWRVVLLGLASSPSQGLCERSRLSRGERKLKSVR